MSTLNTTTEANPPANPNTGDMYLETDTNKIILWDGAVWRKYNPDSPVANNNTNAGSGNEIGSAYSAGIMKVTHGTEWPATYDTDTANFPYFTLPDQYGTTGETIYLGGSDYAGEYWGWLDGTNPGQTRPFGERIYSLTDRSNSGEADIPEYISEWEAVLSAASSADLVNYISNYQDITYLSMQVVDTNNYMGYGTYNLYDNNTGTSYYGFTALTWKHGSTEVISKFFLEDANNGSWVCHDLYVFDVGTVPAYHSGMPVSIKPTAVTIKNAGDMGDATTSFSTGGPTFELTPAVFTS